MMKYNSYSLQFIILCLSIVLRVEVTMECCLLVNSHPHLLSMGRLEFVCKRSESPWRMLGFHEQLVF